MFKKHFLAVLGNEPTVLCVLDRGWTIDLHPQLFYFLFYYFMKLPRMVLTSLCSHDTP